MDLKQRMPWIDVQRSSYISIISSQLANRFGVHGHRCWTLVNGARCKPPRSWRKQSELNNETYHAPQRATLPPSHTHTLSLSQSLLWLYNARKVENRNRSSLCNIHFHTTLTQLCIKCIGQLLLRIHVMDVITMREPHPKHYLQLYTMRYSAYIALDQDYINSHNIFYDWKTFCMDLFEIHL